MKQRLNAFNTIELLTTVGMLAVIFTAGFQVFRLAVVTESYTKGYITAELLARDLIELTISKRNEDWNSLQTGTFYLQEDAAAGFVFTAGSETIDEFTRSVTISEVRRNASGNVVASGGTVDEDVYKATADVDWSYRGRNFNVTMVQYLTNWRRF